MIERIGRVPGPPFYPRRQEIPPVEPVDSVVNQKRDTDTVEISEEARRLLEEAEKIILETLAPQMGEAMKESRQAFYDWENTYQQP